MKNKESYDYLPGTSIYLYQRNDMFKMNTDTALLAHFMKVKKEETLLDIGCNNGALMAFAHQFNPKTIIGIDIQAKAIALAEKNMKNLKITNYELIIGDICKTTLANVDVIVCNPPYFQVHNEQHVNAQTSLKIARHEIYLNFPELVAKVANLLSTKGRFYFVHRAVRLQELLVTLAQHHLHAHCIQLVYDENKQHAIQVLVEAYKDGKSNINIPFPQIIKRTSNNK